MPGHAATGDHTREGSNSMKTQESKPAKPATAGAANCINARGRKPAYESRATELRQRLINWKQTPESMRPSLRALARELRTSHALLQHYLNNLEKWQAKEDWRRAREIRDRARAENREMTPWEEQQARAHNRSGIRHYVTPILLKNLEEIRRDAERGLLHPAQLKILKISARQGLPGALELLEKCAHVRLKERKPFAAIVKETPRLEGETGNAWVHRIWTECDKYVTNIPSVLSEELLEKYQKSAEPRPQVPQR
jgi:hypothetical protein